MNKFARYLVIIFCLWVPGTAIAQNQPDPLDQEKNDLLPAFNEKLAQINQGVVDDKNAALSSNAPVIPTITAPAVTTTNGTIVITFTDGTLLPSDLGQLWAQVTYNGNTEYWKLDPSMISADGKSFSMQFGPNLDNTTLKWQLYGFAADGTKTNLSNAVTFKVDAGGTLTMPQTTAPATTTAAGQLTITFAQPILPEQLNGLWAKVEYDAKTEYWKLDPSMISGDGRTFTITFDPQFNGKTMTMSLYGYAASDNSQTNYSNAVSFTIRSPGTLTIPAITAPGSTDLNSAISIGLASPVLPSTLSELWAIISYDGKTEYWKLDPAMISADGTTLSMTFTDAFIGKNVGLQLYGISASDSSKTNISNKVSFEVIAAESTVTIPALPAAVTADVNGKAVIYFSDGTLQASQIGQLWVEVKYDGKTEYWNIGTEALAQDGKSLTLQFASSFQGKTVAVRVYGYDANDIQTGFSNTTNISIPTAQASVTMPALPATVTADVNSKAVITFAGGTILPSQLNGLWAKVEYDGKTEYWDIGTGALAQDGKSLTLQFASSFQGKTVVLSIYGFDTNDIQTGYSNNVSVVIPSSNNTPAMPTLPETLTTDNSGKAVITFAGGTILPSQLNGLWAEVQYDGKTEYWNIGTGALAQDGKSLTMQFASSFQGKVVAVRLYGFDTQDKQTSFSNTVNITVAGAQSAIVMPTVPSYATTDSGGTATIAFTNGALPPVQLSQFWVEVTYDNKTEYWNISPDALNLAGTTVTLKFIHDFNGKTVRLRFYGFDTDGFQTLFTNPVIIQNVTS